MIKNKLIKNKIAIYIIFFLIIIFGYFLNQLTFDFYNFFGIKPRELTINSISGIFLSWTMHSDFQHLKGNLIILMQLFIPFLIFEKKPLKNITWLIIFSGLYVWLFGLSNTNHVGASGLVFAMFGYMLASIIFQFNIIYLILLVLFGFEMGFIYSIYNGLIPKENISFAAHFGGFVTGAGYSYLNRIKMKKKH